MRSLSVEMMLGLNLNYKQNIINIKVSGGRSMLW